MIPLRLEQHIGHGVCWKRGRKISLLLQSSQLNEWPQRDEMTALRQKLAFGHSL